MSKQVDCSYFFLIKIFFPYGQGYCLSFILSLKSSHKIHYKEVSEIFER